MKIVSSEQMKKIDEDCIVQGTSGLTLMERAGENFVKILKSKFINLQNKKVLILTGKGNNGGDGLVIARKLFEEGSRVKVVLLSGIDELSENAKTNFDKARKLEIDFIEYNGVIKDRFKDEIEKVDLIIDAVARRSIFEINRSLNHGGQYIVVGGSVTRILQVMLLKSWLLKKWNKKMQLLMHQPNKDLDSLSELFAAGKVKPFIDKVYPLGKTADAFRYFGEGKFKGKVVITMTNND